MKKAFTISEQLKAPPEEVYQAWISGEGHSAMTGSPATVDPRVGGKFTAWDGYIRGETLELQPPSRIVQSWRTGDFSASDPDSRIEVTFGAAKGGTRITLVHSGIPEGQADNYENGWKEWYFSPMRDYFGN
jgi:uncharacterized protein YndB with AHSA1/START domain